MIVLNKDFRERIRSLAFYCVREETLKGRRGSS